MSPETVGAGWLLVGAAFAVVGIGIIAACRWSRDDKPVRSSGYEVAAIGRNPVCPECVRRGIVSSPKRDSFAAMVAESEAEIHRAARDSETLRVAGLVSVAPVIPLQRDGRDS